MATKKERRPAKAGDKVRVVRDGRENVNGVVHSIVPSPKGDWVAVDTSTKGQPPKILKVRQSEVYFR